MQFSFGPKLKTLYDAQTMQHDPRFTATYILCSLLLLSVNQTTWSVFTRRKEVAGPVNPMHLKPDLPTHEEGVGRTLAVKPDQRLSIFSLYTPSYYIGTSTPRFMTTSQHRFQA